MSVFGTIDNPFRQLAPGTTLSTSVGGSGLIVLISSLYKMAIIFAGVYTLWGFIAGGYIFIRKEAEYMNRRYRSNFSIFVTSTKTFSTVSHNL